VFIAAIIESICCVQALRKKEFKGETADDVMVRVRYLGFCTTSWLRDAELLCSLLTYFIRQLTELSCSLFAVLSLAERGAQ